MTAERKRKAKQKTAYKYTTKKKHRKDPERGFSVSSVKGNLYPPYGTPQTSHSVVPPHGCPVLLPMAALIRTDARKKAAMTTPTYTQAQNVWRNKEMVAFSMFYKTHAPLPKESSVESKPLPPKQITHVPPSSDAPTTWIRHSSLLCPILFQG